MGARRAQDDATEEFTVTEMLLEPSIDDPPSVYAISAWVDGEPGSLIRVANLTLQRTVLIAPGLYFAGIREPAMLFKATLGTTLSLTLGLTLIYWWNRNRT